MSFEADFLKYVVSRSMYAVFPQSNLFKYYYFATKSGKISFFQHSLTSSPLSAAYSLNYPTFYLLTFHWRKTVQMHLEQLRLGLQ